MNENIKNKWIQALRSDDYNQTIGKLRDGKDTNAFCCLGVLCDVYQKEVGGEWFDQVDVIKYNMEVASEQTNTYFRGAEDVFASAGVVVRDVLRWSGLCSSTGDINPEAKTRYYDKHKYFPFSLSAMNDTEGKTFNEIADYIEENWRDL